MQFDAFLSYSHQDKFMMRRVQQDLEDAGLAIWTDETLIPGTPSWKNAIESAIQSSQSLVVLLSPDAKHSDWVEREIEYAQACGIPVIPLLVRGQDEISAIPFELINAQRIDIRENYEDGIELLVNALQSDGSLTLNPTPHHQQPVMQKPFEELNPNSFYDHVRLFWWLFMTPEKIISYRQRYGDDALSKTASWLIADLVWITLLAPAIGIVLGTVTVTSPDPTITLWLQAISGLVFFAGWFITGWFGWHKSQQALLALLIGTTLSLLALFSSVQTYAQMNLAEQGGFTRPVFLVLMGMLLGTGAGIAFRMAQAATATVAGILLSALLFNAAFGVSLGLDGGIMAILMFLVTILVAWVVDKSLHEGIRTIYHTIALAVIIGAGSLMIIVYFLGGWIFLQGMTL